MEQTIQNLFGTNPYFAFAGFVALIAVCLYVIKKLKNVIIGIVILLLALSVYLYRIDVISGDVFSRVIKAKSFEEIQDIYHTYVSDKKSDIKDKAKGKIIHSLIEDLE